MECLKGVAKQETDFPFVHLVIDDASTDGEQDVIKKWMNQECEFGLAEYYENEDYSAILVPNKKNPNFTLVVYFLKKNMYGNPNKRFLLESWQNACSYEALCEGDDYWISAENLQKQVNLLDAHPEYVVCNHAFYKLFNDKELQKYEKFSSDFEFDIKDYFSKWPVQPLTTLIRTSALPTVEEVKKYKYYRDNHIYYLLLSKGNGYFLNDYMGVYRINLNGIWSSLSKRRAAEIDCLSFFELLANYSSDKLLKSRCSSLVSTYLTYSLLEHKRMESVPLSLSLLGVGGATKAVAYGIYCYFRRLLRK